MAAAQRVQRSKPAVLYALDAVTGKELWSSGTTIGSFVRGVAPSAGDGQVYVVTFDGTVYAFGDGKWYGDLYKNRIEPAAPIVGLAIAK